jgi:non-ribosomal peptide synthetase component F
LRIESLQTEMIAAKYDLNLVVAELERGLTGTFVYSTDLFDASTIAGMAESLQQILHDAAVGLTSDVGTIATTATIETDQWLNAFNADLG